MTLATASALLLGAGLTLGLLLAAGPAVSASTLRVENVRGHRVSLVPGLFPALSVALGAAARAFIDPGQVGIPVVAAGVTFGLTGLIRDAIDGGGGARFGLDIHGLLVVTEMAAAVVVAGQVASGPAAVAASAAALCATAWALSGAWPSGSPPVAALAGFAGLVAWVGESALLTAAAPAVAGALVLAPLDLRGRLRAGRATAGTLGAALGTVVAARATTWACAVVTLVGLSLAVLPTVVRRRRAGSTAVAAG